MFGRDDLRSLPVLATLLGVRPGDEQLIYRQEVTAIIGALADLVVEVRRIRELLEDEEEADEEGDF
jgi:hypothetical protein